MSKQSKNYASHKEKNNQNSKNEINIIYMLPIIFVISVLPLIVKIHEYQTGLSAFDWFSTNDSYFDFFLYYKQLLLNLTAVIMIVIMLYHRFVKKEKLGTFSALIPLGCYAVLALLSSVISDHRSFSFTGIFEQFESVFALLAYCIVLYYAFSFVKSERDVRYITYALLSSIFVLTFICLTQILGHDFYQTQLGWDLISNSNYRDYKENFSFASQAGYAYLSFFNQNYIGMYVSMVLPLILFMAIYTKHIWIRLLFVISIFGLLLCLYGSKSTSGFIGLSISLLLALILFWKSILKYFKIFIPALVVIAFAIFIFNQKTSYISLQLEKITNLQKVDSPMLSDIQTNEDNIIIKYNGHSMKVIFQFNEHDGTCTFKFLDENDLTISSSTDETNGLVSILDIRYPGFVFAPSILVDNTVGFSVQIDGRLWYFTNQYNDNTYYYINNYGKYTKIITAPSAVFTGYEPYASGRGYIWSRTIPLLKDRILLGTGADAFVFAFPQSDYVNMTNYGFGGQLMTKPHSLYLQIAVQTGVISLFAFLILYGMYFVASVRLYINGVFKNIYTVVGASILIGTTGYMVCGIANDSSVTVAPIFWLLLGIGFAMNQKVKKELVSEAASK